MEVGRNQIDLPAIATVTVFWVHTDTDIDEFPQ